ncbi:hypothetical protein BK004_01735 [bacterium CG10_46_32]|nr:MAG: hypothetical protein BK004_01735 [bacterium CG10_46_32]PIR56263.1 MAG: hypothetical protein COU73_01765 [Parcubacteria group bacterium CG10_big_fil_rev_8_21_14_0_10_46_32]
MWESIGSLVPKSVQKAGISKSISDAMVCEEFDKIAAHILGAAASKCRAVYLKDHTLWVAVLSNSVSSELKMYEQDILKALVERFGENHVSSLRFMI